VISIKKYLDMESAALPPAAVELPPAQTGDSASLSAVLLRAYSSALLSMARSGAQACPASGADLQTGLSDISLSLSKGTTSEAVPEMERQVEERLKRWGGSTSEYFKAKAAEVRELLLVLAGTAESMGERDQGYARQILQFTTQLQGIADLEDLTQVRTLLVQRAREMKACVDQITEESRQSVTRLRSEIAVYETRLLAAEQMAAQDSLTSLVNRRGLEDRIESRIQNRDTFSLILLDLNNFKQVNDKYGHDTGDDLLRQFAGELRSNARPADVVGRWGGDEFVIILDCDIACAQGQIEGFRRWVFGDYRLKAGRSEVKVAVKGSVGLTQWRPGQTLQDVIKNADAAMYKEKKSHQQSRTGLQKSAANERE
jgi:diguanylate cyclase